MRYSLSETLMAAVLLVVSMAFTYLWLFTQDTANTIIAAILFVGLMIAQIVARNDRIDKDAAKNAPALLHGIPYATATPVSGHG